MFLIVVLMIYLQKNEIILIFSYFLLKLQNIMLALGLSLVNSKHF